MDELPLPWPLDREVWRPIPGYEGWYDASCYGRIRSWKGWRGRRLAVPSICAQGAMPRTGHRKVTVTEPGGIRTLRLVHRLLAKAFIGLPTEGAVCRHHNGDPTDNSVNNVCWGTPADNSRDMIRHGTSKRPGSHGVKNGCAKLDDGKVREVRRRLALGEKQYVIAEDMNVSKGLINQIAKNRIWLHVS